MKKITKIITLLLLTIFLCACNSNIFFKNTYIVKYYDGDEVIYKYQAEEGSVAKNKIIEKEGYTFLGWDINGDGIVDELPTIKSSINLKAVYKESSDIAQTVTYKFVSDDEILDTRIGKKGEVLILPNCTKESTKEYNFYFLGWDANDDGVPESNSYELTEDVVFKALYRKEKIKYTYSIYDKGLLVKQETVDYGTEIEYPNIDEYIFEDGKYKLFSGWNYEGHYESFLKTVTSNLTINSEYSSNQVLVLYYENSFFVIKAELGKKLLNDALANEELKHNNEYRIHFYTDSNYENEYQYQIMDDSYLELYCRLEKTDEINDIILLDNKDINSAYSIEGLINIFNNIILKKITTKTIEINFDFDNLNNLLNYICNNSISIRNYNLSAAYSGSLLTLNLIYDEPNFRTSEVIHYNEIKSLNVEFNKTRDDSFNNFYIDNVNKTYNVVDSDSLFYVLEHGYKPIIDDPKLLELYEKMRDVLRNIIDDSMTKQEKALKIYDWIITNCIYDNEILLKTDNVKEYNSFFLEGVFNDHLAVCDGISKAYAALCNIEGIKCVQVTGKSTTRAINHAWNKVEIDGYWYIVDPTSGGTIVGNKEIVSHYFFMISSDEYKNYYIEEKSPLSNKARISEYNIYDNLAINQSHVKVNSIEEAGKLFSLLNNITETSSLEMYLDFSITNLENTIQEIISYNKVKIKVNYLTYLKNDKYVIIFIVEKN